MVRRLRIAALWLLLVLALLLYREWVVRHAPALYTPLGFFEQATGILEPAQDIQDPVTWRDPIPSVVMDKAMFDVRAQAMHAEARTVDVLVTGATFGGLAAALSAAEDRVTVLVTSPSDWKSILRADAALFLTDQQEAATPQSSIERALQDLKADGRGTPEDIVEQFALWIEHAANLDIAPPSTLVALTADDGTTLNRALFQSTDGTRAFVVRFAYLIDGTHEGSTLARAGIPTRTSWDTTEDTGEPRTLSAIAVTALTEGYTLSGRTLPGIGRRLDGQRMQMGLRDRGYQGRFAAPSDGDACWIRDTSRTVSPFIPEQPILRSKTIGCQAITTFQSSFEDTVEVFFINHGNDHLRASVTLGSGTTLRIDTPINPLDPFVRIGAFPLGPRSPLTIRMENVLPTDRLEGWIARKLNTGTLGNTFYLDRHFPQTFQATAWKQATYDIVLRTSSVLGMQTMRIDDQFVTVRRRGPGTYSAENVPLAEGTHTLTIPDGDGIQQATIVPIRPIRPTLTLNPLPIWDTTTTAAGRWTFTAQEDGPASLIAPPGACHGVCTMILTEQGALSVPLLREDLTSGMGTIASAVPIGTLTVRKGSTYVLTANAPYDSASPPIVFMTAESADLYASGNDSAASGPALHGGIYDIWVRSSRADDIRVALGTTRHLGGTPHTWQYVGTEPLPREGFTVRASGNVELMAFPNALVDANVLPLFPDEITAPLLDLPPLSYALTSFGIADPVQMQIVADNAAATSVLTFEGENGTYIATSRLSLNTSPRRVSLLSKWPQRLVLYEKMYAPAAAQSASGLLIPLSIDQQLIFDPYPSGIGPVTIGSETDERDHTLRSLVEDSTLLLRYQRTHLTAAFEHCSREANPTCDGRRYVPHPAVFQTADGLSPVAISPDGRRLAGQETLTVSGAYAVQQSCVACYTECIAGSEQGVRCALLRTAVIPWNAIVSFPGQSKKTSIDSPQEQAMNTLSTVLSSLRRDGILRTSPTYLESPFPARDISLTLGMFFSSERSNVTAANSTISTTHAAARAVRSPTAALAIGSAIGHAIAFALTDEHASLAFIAASRDATLRLQRALVDRGITVMPVEQSGNSTDPLLLKAIQRILIDQRGTLDPVWRSNRLSYAFRAVDTLRPSAHTIRDALRLLPGGTPDASDADLLRRGLSSGFLTRDMLQLIPDDLLELPLDEALLLKLDYLLRVAT